MSDIDQQKRHPRWPIYLLSGCGVLVILGIIAVVCVLLTIRTGFIRITDEMLNPKPIVRTAPYHFGYEDQAAKVSIKLPNDYGTIVYEHDLIDTREMCGGQRAVLLRCNNSIKQEWPLPYYSLGNVKVGVYWYPATSNQGPILRFYDASGESALDFGQNEVGQIARSGGKAFLCYYAYNNTEFSSSMSKQAASGGSMKYYSADGSPANDITSVSAPSNCIYLGSIIRKGNKLVFVANPDNTKP